MQKNDIKMQSDRKHSCLLICNTAHSQTTVWQYLSQCKSFCPPTLIKGIYKVYKSAFIKEQICQKGAASYRHGCLIFSHDGIIIHR